MKKSILLVVFIAVVFVGMLLASDSNKRYGIVYTTGEVGDGRYATMEEATKALMSKHDIQKINSATTIIDTVFKNWSDDLEPYFGGGPGDTMVVYFDPGPVIIKKIVCNIGYNGADPPPPMVDGVNVSLNWANYDGFCDVVIGDGNKTLMGTMALDGTWTPEAWYAERYSKPPVGAPFWGSFPLSVIAEPEDALEEIETIWMGFEPDNEGKPFVVSFVAYGAAGTVNGFADRQQEGVLADDERMWKWYTTDNGWYNWRQIGFRMYLIVEFYANTPPVISNLTVLPGTYDMSKDFVVQANLSDIDASDETKGGIAEAYVVWTTKTGKVDSVAMTNISGDQWEGKITGLKNDDLYVTYWVGAKDKGDPALYSKSITFSFEIGPMNPNADLLLVLQWPHNAQFYRDALDNLGFVYEEWNADANGGIDASVTGFGWGTIVVAGAGWGANTVPTRSYDGNPYAAFLNSGGNMFLGDMDLFYTNGEPADTTFAAGDFVYDFFGVASCLNDPGENADSVIYGVDGDPISGNWAETPLFLNWYAYSDNRNYNWIDYITAANTTTIFNAESQNAVGVRYEGSNFKTVFLGFMPDAMGEETASPDFDKLIQNVLTWFETKQAVSVETGDNTPVVNTYSLKQNYPNPFNPVTRIEYTIPEAGQVNIAIYNVLGKKVAELVNKHQKAGKYDIIWDAKDAANGVYFYKMKAGDYTKTMKMLLLR